MKRVIILALFLMFAGAYAQKNSLLILKNGSEIRGDVEQTADGKYKVKTFGGSTLVYSKDEVLSVEKYRSKVSRSGYFCRLDGGIIGGANDASPSFHIVNGYAVNNKLQFGLGMGIEAVRWDAYIPAFLEGRYHLLNNASSPFIYAMSGYEVPLSNFQFNKGGYIGGVGAGFSHSFQVYGQTFGISTSLGYKFGWMRQNNSWWDDFVTVTQINRFELRFALTIR